jgi:hypothetical protein
VDRVARAARTLCRAIEIATALALPDSDYGSPFLSATQALHGGPSMR